jgi:hypothetical protein
MTIEEKKEKIADLRKFHEPAFKAINVEDALYIPRMAYKPSGHNEVIISFFASELKNEKDIYTEFVSKDYQCEDPNRVLWKWKFNPFWTTEYAKSDDPIPTAIKYYIPTSELVVISRNGEVRKDKQETEDVVTPIKTDLSAMLKKSVPIATKEVPKSEITELLDTPIKDLTLRQLREILNKL